MSRTTGGTHTRTCLQQSQNRDGEERHTRLTRNRAASSVLPVPGAQARHLWGILPPKRLIFAGLRRNSTISSRLFFCGFGRWPATSSKVHAAMLFRSASWPWTYPKGPSHPPFCADPGMRFHEIDPYTNRRRIGSSDIQEWSENRTVAGARRAPELVLGTSAGWLDFGVFGRIVT